MPSRAHQYLGHRRRRRHDQGDHPAPGPDGRHQILRRRRAQQPDGPRGGLLDRLQQRVGGLLGAPVGVLEQHDLPAPAGRRARRPQHQVPGLLHAVGQPVRADQHQVGVGAGLHLAAGRALTAAAGRAQQRRRERPRRDRAARSGRPGEQPRVRHRARFRAAPRPAPGRRRRRPGSAGSTTASCPVRSAKAPALGRWPRCEAGRGQWLAGLGHRHETSSVMAGNSPV